MVGKVGGGEPGKTYICGLRPMFAMVREKGEREVWEGTKRVVVWLKVEVLKDRLLSYSDK